MIFTVARPKDSIKTPRPTSDFDFLAMMAISSWMYCSCEQCKYCMNLDKYSIYMSILMTENSDRNESKLYYAYTWKINKFPFWEYMQLWIVMLHDVILFMKCRVTHFIKYASRKHCNLYIFSKIKFIYQILPTSVRDIII